MQEKKIIFKALLVVIIVSAVIVIGSGLSGCYTLRQGMTMIGYLNRSIPLELANDQYFVHLVGDIRKFAEEDLGLLMSNNYTRYVELDRYYLAAVVSASAMDSFERHEWRFPVVGRLPYKGFFDREDAFKERDKLVRRNLDVWIRSVDAFSSLGWFNDPLYSFMRYYTPYRLADLIIHELVHATVFIRGQIQFNEELAQFIGSEGARLFIEKQYGLNSEEYRNMFINEADSQAYILFIQSLISELEVLYSSDLNRESILIEKERIISNAKERFEADYDNMFSGNAYRGFIELQVNNAYFELFRLYHAEDDFYGILFEQSGSDLPAFIAAAKTITRRGGNPRVQLENALLGKP